MRTLVNEHLEEPKVVARDWLFPERLRIVGATLNVVRMADVMCEKNACIGNLFYRNLCNIVFSDVILLSICSVWFS